jgi:hypothetical protein
MIAQDSYLQHFVSEFTEANQEKLLYRSEWFGKHDF